MELPSSNSTNDSFAFLLVTAARLMRARMEAALREEELGITTSEARTLAMAHRTGPTKQAELAANLGIEPVSLVSHLDNLEKAGLVRREPDPSDRRGKLVHLTAEAEPKLKHIHRVLNSARESAMQNFSLREMEAFQTYLQRLCQDLAGES